MAHRSDSVDRRAVVCALWMLAVAPALAIVVFYAGVVHARLLLGRWPASGHPNPSEIHSILFTVHYSMTAIAVILTSLSPIAWMAMLPVAETFATLKWFLFRLFVYLISLVAFLTLVRLDPGGFVGWFVD